MMNPYEIGWFLIGLAVAVFVVAVDLFLLAMLAYGIKDRDGVMIFIFFLLSLFFLGVTVISVGAVFGL